VIEQIFSRIEIIFSSPETDVAYLTHCYFGIFPNLDLNIIISKKLYIIAFDQRRSKAVVREAVA